MVEGEVGVGVEVEVQLIVGSIAQFVSAYKNAVASVRVRQDNIFISFFMVHPIQVLRSLALY